MAKLSERYVLLVKNESQYGIDAVPTAALNAIPVAEKPKMEFDLEKIERKHPFPSRGKIKPVIGKKATKLPFKMEYFGSGVATTPPRIGDIIESCGFTEVIGGVDVSYSPGQASLKSNSIYSYVDGLLYKIFGAVGSMKISGKAGQPVYFDFDMLGLYQDDADAAIVAPTFEANYKTPPQLMGISFTLDSITTFVLREFNIDMAIPVIKREDMAGAQGYAGFMVGKQNPTGSLIIEGTSKATYDFLAKFEAATEVAAEIIIGSVAGNKLTITLPTISFTDLKINDVDGLVTFELPISINLNSGNGSEITLKHS